MFRNGALHQVHGEDVAAEALLQPSRPPAVPGARVDSEAAGPNPQRLDEIEKVLGGARGGRLGHQPIDDRHEVEEGPEGLDDRVRRVHRTQRYTPLRGRSGSVGGLAEPTAIDQPPGEWWGADPRYRGYRPTRKGVKLDHRVRQAIALVPGAATRLLDLGAGDAFVSAELAGAAGALVGVSADVGRPAPLAPRRHPVTRVTARLPGPLPFPNGAFDVVVALEVIEHLLDPDAFLDEVLRVLAPKGSLILSTPRLDSLLVVASLLLGMQPPGVEASSRHRYGSPIGEQRPSGHVHLFTRRAMRDALHAHGLRIDEYREGRFSSSWWQAVRSTRRPRLADLAVGAGLKVYDLIPWRKDVMVVRAVRETT